VTEHRQGKGDTLTKFNREGDRVVITSRRLGYPIPMDITPELLDFLKLENQDPIDIVRDFAARIQNGRTIADAARHTGLELQELNEEIALKDQGLSPGPDGVIGEAIDIIACALDIIFVEAPETTNQQINSILLAKCEKWARRYKDSIDGDRSID
jgi:hypothetical protein